MKRDHVIKLVALNGVGQPTEHDGRYLAAYDPTRHPPLGQIRSTDDAALALAFLTPGDARAFWGQRHGTRPDGQPNRPLTAYAIQIERLVDIV